MNLSKPKRSQDMESTSLPDGYVVIINKKTNWAHTLTPLAGLVWEFCDGENSVPEIVSKIQAIPEIGVSESLQKEVVELVGQLEEEGFFDED